MSNAQPRSRLHVTPSDVQSRRYSLWAIANQASQIQDDKDLVDDDLSKAEKRLKVLKAKISSQSKKNFELERDVRYLDSRIALLIQHRLGEKEPEELAQHLDGESAETSSVNFPDDRHKQHYGNLFFLLQTEPQHIATLTKMVNMTEIDNLLQTVMFTLFGNQYESREEHLLLSVFQLVLADQFEEAKDDDMGTLMRANTPASRMMTTYTRRGPGQSYLKNSISRTINKLVGMEDNLEINPLKVYEQMINDMEVETGQTSPLPRSVTPDQAAENSQVKALIKPRVDTLLSLAEEFLDVIILSLDSVPYGIRWICKQIKVLTKRKYPDASEFNVASLIGAFFMLRFMNPAIVTPNAYMLVDHTPSANGRRTLTLVAKMLQNLTNKPNYSKESYMLPLNSFIEENKDRMTKFFFDLCEVEDFHEQLEIDLYIALTKKDLSINITLNEIYNTHELLCKYMDQLAPNDDNHLRIVLQDLGPAPKQLPRSENKSFQLSLFSRWEIPLSEEWTKNLKASLTDNEILYMDTKNLIVQILRHAPSLTTRPLNIESIVNGACNYKSNGAVTRRGNKARECLRKLEAAGLGSPKDGYKQLTEEISQELSDLEKLRERNAKEIESLDQVYAIIQEHNNYLRSQLESYRAYLQNVRMQSGPDSSRNVKSGAQQTMGPFKFSHSQLEKDGVIVESDVPENRRSNIYFNFISPMPGTFVIALHYRGREKPILELDLKLDDLLEKQQVGDQTLDLEYVQFNVNKMLHLLNKTFLKK